MLSVPAPVGPKTALSGRPLFQTAALAPFSQLELLSSQTPPGKPFQVSVAAGAQTANEKKVAAVRRAGKGRFVGFIKRILS